MTDLSCEYPGDRDGALIAYLYDDSDPATRAAFEAHFRACALCRDEIAALRGVRGHLARWAPPEPSFAIAAPNPTPQSAIRNPQSTWSWREIPAWAQVAAALLFLGVSAGIANLDVRYDQNGLSVRTGWSQNRSSGSGESGGSGGSRVAQPPSRDARFGEPGGVTPASGATAPWRADLAALERRLRNDLRASPVMLSPAPVAQPPRAAAAADADTLRRVRALLEESEKRQQRELALRVAEVVRDVNAQRQVDLRNIDRSLGFVENNLGVQVLKQQQSLNLLYRASQRQ